MDSEASSIIGELSGRITALEKKIDFLFRHLKIEYKETMEPYMLEAKALLEQNKETESVKLVRNTLNCGLAEANSIVQKLKNS